MILCKIFGHKTRGYYRSAKPYGRIEARRPDATGRLHGVVYCRCDRCDEEYEVVRVHQHPDTRAALAQPAHEESDP